MSFISSSYNEFSSEDYNSGYNQAVKDITEYITQLKSYYERGAMCSLSESVQGKCTCDEILNHLEEMTGGNNK